MTAALLTAALACSAGEATSSAKVGRLWDLETLTRAEALALDGRRGLFRVRVLAVGATTAEGGFLLCVGPRGFGVAAVMSPNGGAMRVSMTVEATVRVVPLDGGGKLYRLDDVRPR
jgi:hypothetical protein